jgi:mxaK protein
MGLSARSLMRAALLLLAVAGIGAAIDLASWWQLHRLAQRIASVATAAPADDAPPALRFARAAHLAEQGEIDAALNLYRSLHTDRQLGAAARYNASNLLMRQAMALQNSASAGQAVPLIELAKQGYRELLRHDPDHWDARYNLERAQRLLPEPEETDPAIAEPRNDAERAATTMRGVAPGLP